MNIIGDLIIKRQIESGVPASVTSIERRTSLDWNALEGECIKRQLSLLDVILEYMEKDVTVLESERDIIAALDAKAKMAAALLDKAAASAESKPDAGLKTIERRIIDTRD